MPASASASASGGYAPAAGSAFHTWLTGGAFPAGLIETLANSEDDEGMSILACSGCKAASCVCPPVCKVCDRAGGRHKPGCILRK